MLSYYIIFNLSACSIVKSLEVFDKETFNAMGVCFKSIHSEATSGFKFFIALYSLLHAMFLYTPFLLLEAYKVFVKGEKWNQKIVNIAKSINAEVGK